MNKKGFTLIEIIVCISLIVIIGVSCFFGIRYVSKQIKITKLEQLSDRIIEAAQVYIETHKETHNQLYKENNGVVLPINVLVDEGLLQIDNTKITKEDYKNEYVVALLGDEVPSGNECINTTIQKSWIVNNKPIYICTKSDGSSNLISVGSVGNNLSNAVQEKFYYSGSIDNNFATIKGKGGSYRILYIDTDDSIVLVNLNGNFSGVFTENQVLPVYGCLTYGRVDEVTINVTCNGSGPSVGIDDSGYRSGYRYCDSYTSSSSLDGVGLTASDYSDTIKCYENYNNAQGFGNYGESAYGYGYTNYVSRGWLSYSKTSKNRYKIHLRSCMKIVSGTGDIATPFVIDSTC